MRVKTVVNEDVFSHQFRMHCFQSRYPILEETFNITIIKLFRF